MDNVGLNKQLRQIRRFRNITQKRLGNAVGLSEAQICHLEKGNRKISSDLLFKLEDFLDIKFESNIDKKYTLKEIKKAMEKLKIDPESIQFESAVKTKKIKKR